MLDIIIYLYEDGDTYVAETRDDAIRVRQDTPEKALATLAAGLPLVYDVAPSASEGLRRLNDKVATVPSKEDLIDAAINYCSEIYIEGTHVDGSPMVPRYIAPTRREGNLMWSDEPKCYRIDKLTLVEYA